VVQLPAGTPTTREELAGLQHKRSQLSEQLNSVDNRRRDLRRDLERSPLSARPGIEAQLKVLDDRAVGLERDLSITGQQLANVPGVLVASTQMPGDQIAERIAGDIVPIVAILAVFVLGPFAVAMARLIWKRGSAAPRPVADNATVQRLEQLQQSVDTIALEVERISESQRFVTKILAERDRPALGVRAAPAEPIVARQGARSERG